MIQYCKIWIPVFEGEDSQSDDTGAAAAKVATQDNGDDGDNDSSTQAGHDSNSDAATSGVITQEKMNQILKAEKKKFQRTLQKAIDEASAASKRAQLTAQERADLDNRLELIQNEMRTKDEQSKRAADKQRKAHQEQLLALENDRNYWKKEFTESTIERSITDAAATNNAFSPRQIVAILGPHTTLVPRLDEDGKPTSILEPKVRYHSKDKEGKPVTLDLSPTDAIKRMKDEEEYLNLFRGEGSGGAGLRSQPGSKKADVKQLATNPAAYREARKKGQVKFE